MAYAQATVLVEKPISEVFQFILDGENNKLWRPTVMDIKRNSDEPVGVGAVFIQGMRIPNGMRINADYEIIECDEDRKISFKVLNGPYRAIGTFTFEQQENGAKVTFSMSEETGAEDHARDLHLQNVVNTLANVKVHLESGK